MKLKRSAGYTSDAERKLFPKVWRRTNIFLNSLLQVNPPLVRPHKPIKTNKNDLEISMLGLQFVVSSQHFINGRVKVKFLCSCYNPCPVSRPSPPSHFATHFCVKLIEWETFSLVMASFISFMRKHFCPCSCLSFLFSLVYSTTSHTPTLCSRMMVWITIKQLKLIRSK